MPAKLPGLPDEIKSLLIVHQGALGDFVLSLPAIEALHHFYPDALITFLAHPKNFEIISARPYVRDVLDCGGSRWAPLYGTEIKIAAAELKALFPVDTSFVFGRSSSQIVVDNLVNSLGKPAYRIDPFPESKLGVALIEYQCRQLQDLGVPAIPPPAAVIAPLPQDLRKVDSFVRRHLGPEDRLVLVHPGSGGPNKLWGAVGWVNLIKKLATYRNLRLTILEGPADNRIVNDLLSQLGDTPLLHLANWRLGKVVGLMRHTALYLGNDSGITHLAAVCGTPTIALFGPTDPRIWGPQGQRVKIVCWEPLDSYVASPSASKPLTISAPETELVWRQAREWLGL